MKKSDIEKQLKKDLNESISSDFEAVWNKCSTQEVEVKELIAETVPVTTDGSNLPINLSRKVLLITTTAIAAFICCAVILCLILFGNSGKNLVLPSYSGYFLIDVNPSIKVNYDTNGVVTAANGLNSDGEELLEGLELDGVNYVKAADAIFDRCVSLGYFSYERDDNAILITANIDDGQKDEEMTDVINKCLIQKFEDKNMKGVVISDVENSKTQKEAEKYGINGQKYELILRYINSGGKLDESEYETITIHELYSFISDSDKNSKDK